MAGVANHELALEAPGGAQPVVGDRLRRDGVIVAPIMDHRDLLGFDAARTQPAGHLLADGDVHRRAAQAPVAYRQQQGRDGFQRGDAESQRDFGVKILQPVDLAQAERARERRDGAAQHRRVGLDDDDVVASGALGQSRGEPHVHRAAVVGAANQRVTAEARPLDPVDVDAAMALELREIAAAVFVESSACDHADLVPALAHLKGEIGQHLTGGGSVGPEEAIDEPDSQLLFSPLGFQSLVRQLASWNFPHPAPLNLRPPANLARRHYDNITSRRVYACKARRALKLTY